MARDAVTVGERERGKRLMCGWRWCRWLDEVRKGPGDEHLYRVMQSVSCKFTVGSIEGGRIHSTVADLLNPRRGNVGSVVVGGSSG